MPFLASFTCLWCGAAHATRGPDDLEGWAQLCPDCLGRAGENPFLRFRLRDALAERAAPRSGRPVREAARSPWPRRRADRRRDRPPAGDLDPRWSPTTRPVPASTTTGTCAAAATATDRSTTWPGVRPRHGRPLARRARARRADRGARDGHGLVVAAPRRPRRAVVLRRGRGAARARPAAPRRARPAGPPPRPRRLGRARVRRRRAVHGLLAQPRPAAAPRRVPRARPALARARRPHRVHRLPPRPVVVGPSTTGRGPT